MIAPDRARDGRTLSALATACATLVFVVVAASAWLRLAAAPCPTGGCEGFVLADAVRLAHRVAAMGVSVLALVIAALAWKAPARPGRRVAAVVILVLVVALAIVGRRSAGSPPPAVLLTNLLGGLALLATTTGMAVAARTPQGTLPPAFAAALAIFGVSVVTGSVLAAAAPGESGMPGLLHQATAWASLAAWGLLAWRDGSSPGTRLAAGLAAAFIAAQVVAALVVTGWPIAPWLHNLLTSAALCAVVGATIASRSRDRRKSAHAEHATIRP